MSVSCESVSVNYGIQQVVSFHQVNGGGSPSLIPLPPPLTHPPYNRTLARPAAGRWRLERSASLSPHPSFTSSTTNRSTNRRLSFFTDCRSSSPHSFISLAVSLSSMSPSASSLSHQFQAAGGGKPVCSVCVWVSVGQCPSIKPY